MLLELKTLTGSVYVKHESLRTVEKDKYDSDNPDHVRVVFRYVDDNSRLNFTYYHNTTEENFKKFIERLSDLEC